MNRIRVPSPALLFLLLAPATACAQGPGPRVTAAVIDSLGNRIGQVTATEDAGGAVLAVEVHGLTPGFHGMHLHAAAKCEPPAFQSAEGHFNPTGKQHGHENPAGPHVGDLPNLQVGEDGSARTQVRVEGWTLRSGSKSIGDPGVALMIHAGPDDDRSDPAGNSGARIACAVLRVTASE
jgi:Cu-Zn family superoxide dismutase